MALGSHPVFRNGLPPSPVGSQAGHSILPFPMRSWEGWNSHHACVLSSVAPQGQGQAGSLSKQPLIKRDPGRSCHPLPPDCTNLVPAFPGCVTLGKVLNLSEPCFPSVEWE